jgi:hypothetical protein
MSKTKTQKLIKEIAEQVGTITAEKNEAYGSSFEKSGQILEILFPDGVKPEQYKDMLLIARMLDKLFRIANDKGAFNEDPFKDLAGYSVLGALAYHKSKNPNEEF